MLLILVLSNCKNITIQDIDADNFRDILKPTGDYSLSSYESGLSCLGSHLGMSSNHAKNFQNQEQFPWTIHNNMSGLGYRIVSFHNSITRENYSISFPSSDSDKIFSAWFIGVPLLKYNECLDHMLRKEGFIYKESRLKNKNDILIKEIKKDVYIVAEVKQFNADQTPNGIPSGFVRIEILTIK